MSKTRLSIGALFRLDWRRIASIAVGYNDECGRLTHGFSGLGQCKPAQFRTGARRPTMAASSKPQTKSATVTRLLSREKGATLDEIAKATEWTPHSCRAFLTGVRQTARVVRQERPDGATSYRIVLEPAPEPASE
jgi:hypothetical protein